VGELFAKHMLEEPPPLTEFVPDAPPYMAAAIMRSLAKDPAGRFAGMEDFRKALVGEVKLVIPAATGPRRSLSSQVLTMSTKTSTTLSSASSEIDDEPLGVPGRGKRWLWGLAGGAAAIAAAVFLLMPKSGSNPGSDSAGGKVEKPPAPMASTAPPAPAPSAPLKKTVTLRFEADPAGAHVYRKKDDQDLGIVPVEVRVPRETGKPGEGTSYVFRLPGYRDLALVADATTDRTLHVSMDRIAAPAPAVEKKHGGSGHHVKKKPVDEDGLATPSF
jgi:hypothetical protein